MIRREGDQLVVDGPVTLDTVPDLAAAMEPLLDAGAHAIDLGAVTEVDSSAVALLLEWRRHAASRHASFRLLRVPAAVQNLAKLYGVSELLEPSEK
jgi:phospholipid transport system transporter-binding protein